MTTPIGSPSMPVFADSVRQRIAAALPLKDDVVLALTQAANSLNGLRRRELMRLSDRIAAVENAEEVLRDARLLELFLPLATAQPELVQREDGTRQGEVERRVFQVLQRQQRQARAKHERWSVVVYPLLVLLLSILVFAFISIYITPVFEQMFREFGLTLPPSTELVILISHIMQSVWFWLLLAVPFMLLVVMLGLRAVDSWRQLTAGSVDDPWLSADYSTRRSLGDLAWHAALLLDAGQEVETSVEIAAAASRNTTLRQASPHLAHHFGLTISAPNPEQNPFVTPQQHRAASSFHGVPCHLLSYALSTRQDDKERSAMLREIAHLYWDREQSQSVWILSWLQPVAVLMISMVVSFVVLALFMPLVDLITGLT